MLKALIVDDEVRAVKMLEAIIADSCEGELDVIAGCHDLPEAVRLIKRHHPDLIFLDIEMPGYSGLQILDFFGPDEVDFEIIFTTAYNEFALQAFKLSAIDYILKPIQPEQIVEAVRRVKSKRNKHDSSQKFSALRNNLDNGISKKVGVAVGQSIKFIPTEDIIYIKAEGAYSEFVLSDDIRLLISKNLKHFEDLLCHQSNFLRIHKSYIINVNHVSEYVKSDGGYVKMDDKYNVSISNEKVDKLLQWLTDQE